MGILDFILVREIDELERQLGVRYKREGTLSARVGTLAADAGRVAWLVRTLAELCLTKGVCTRDELARMLLEVDRADGKEDGRVSAKAVMPGESAPAAPSPARKPGP